MRKTLTTLILTVLLLAALDVMVALGLGWADRNGRLGSLVQYFEYGRSVPGKLKRWQDRPDLPGNLHDVAWRSDLVALSQADFAAETDTNHPVLRSYGMSFVNNILNAATQLDPDLIWDGHAGPSAPPNYTYALFEDDRANRRAGDIVVLGILSSGVPAMAALSNSSWLFEQPAPMTYPVYWPEGDGLRRIEPVISTSTQQRALAQDPTLSTAWTAQLAQDDAFYAPQTFGLTWADASPFARLVRRALVKPHTETVNARILNGQVYPYAEALRRMVRAFAQTARADGQVPIVVLVQTGDARDADIYAITAPVLEADDIPYFATAEHFDPTNRRGFVSDGHYKPEIDRMFGQRLLDLIAAQP